MPRDAALTPIYTQTNFDTGGRSSSEDALLSYGLIAVHLKLSISFGTPDNQVLWTCPAGRQLRVEKAYYKITTSWTGGTASAIGISSDDTDYSTPGDILGGAAGDVAAGLLSTGRAYKGGTLGTKFGSNGVVVIGAGKTLQFNRITSAFTAGAGFLHVEGQWVDS